MTKGKHSIFKEKFTPDQQRVAVPVVAAGTLMLILITSIYAKKAMHYINDSDKNLTPTEEIFTTPKTEIDTTKTTNFFD